MKNSPTNPKSVPSEHIKLLKKLAWLMHERTHCDFDDLFSEACLQYLLLRDRYDASRQAKLTTFLWIGIKNSLFDYIKQMHNFIYQELTDDLIENLVDDYGFGYGKTKPRDKFMPMTF